MAGRTESLSILRTLYRELRSSVNAPQKHVHETQVWRYIVGLCRTCKGQPEVQKNLEQTGRSYVFYLQGTREYHRISEEYKGAGERSADETAKLLGFKMPNEPREERKPSSKTSSTTATAAATKVDSNDSDKSYRSATSSLGFNTTTEVA